MLNIKSITIPVLLTSISVCGCGAQLSTVNNVNIPIEEQWEWEDGASAESEKLFSEHDGIYVSTLENKTEDYIEFGDLYLNVKSPVSVEKDESNFLSGKQYIADRSMEIDNILYINCEKALNPINSKEDILKTGFNRQLCNKSEQHKKIRESKEFDGLNVNETVYKVTYGSFTNYYKAYIIVSNEPDKSTQKIYTILTPTLYCNNGLNNVSEDTMYNVCTDTVKNWIKYIVESIETYEEKGEL